jgi:hypothetical protein
MTSILRPGSPILARLPDHPVKQIDELLPWTWNKARQLVPAAAA